MDTPPDTFSTAFSLLSQPHPNILLRCPVIAQTARHRSQSAPAYMRGIARPHPTVYKADSMRRFHAAARLRFHIAPARYSRCSDSCLTYRFLKIMVSICCHQPCDNSARHPRPWVPSHLFSPSLHFILLLPPPKKSTHHMMKACLPPRQALTGSLTLARRHAFRETSLKVSRGRSL